MALRLLKMAEYLNLGFLSTQARDSIDSSVEVVDRLKPLTIKLSYITSQLSRSLGFALVRLFNILLFLLRVQPLSTGVFPWSLSLDW